MNGSMYGNAEPTSDPEQLKDQGNFYFKDKEYEVAIDLYSQAIGMSPLSTSSSPLTTTHSPTSRPNLLPQPRCRVHPTGKI